MNVSIRSRPGGREIRHGLCNRPTPSSCFNPLPARRPGDTKRIHNCFKRRIVSIRSRPGGREILHWAGGGASYDEFQSAPGPEAGRYMLARLMGSPASRFNPLPARRPGDTLGCRTVHSRYRRFNPLPARRPGDTPLIDCSMCKSVVSIRSRPGGREIRSIAVSVPTLIMRFQSAPGPEAGRYYP